MHIMTLEQVISEVQVVSGYIQICQWMQNHERERELRFRRRELMQLLRAYQAREDQANAH